MPSEVPMRTKWAYLQGQQVRIELRRAHVIAFCNGIMDLACSAMEWIPFQVGDWHNRHQPSDFVKEATWQRNGLSVFLFLAYSTSRRLQHPVLHAAQSAIGRWILSCCQVSTVIHDVVDSLPISRNWVFTFGAALRYPLPECNHMSSSELNSHLLPL